MQRFITLVAIMSLTGCTHHQLRFNTVKQAHTVADVHTQQVLDNIAKFAVSCDALPHFSWPNAGAAEVSDSVDGSIAFNFTPFRLRDWGLGGGAGRGMRESYTMTPINDPRKLELMRCAYQRAVSSCCTCGESGLCPDCQRRFNKFYLGSESPSYRPQKTYYGQDVYRLFDPDSGDEANLTSYQEVFQDQDIHNSIIFRYVASGAVVPNDEIIEALEDDRLVQAVVWYDVREHTRQTGNVTAACLQDACWFHVGCRRDVPKGCPYVGHYRGVYVWVPEEHVDKLTELTLTVLDVALHDPPPSSTKEVIAYLDGNGAPTANRRNATFQVTQTIPASATAGSIAPMPKTLQELLEEAERERRRRIHQLASMQQKAGDANAAMFLRERLAEIQGENESSTIDSVEDLNSTIGVLERRTHLKQEDILLDKTIAEANQQLLAMLARLRQIRVEIELVKRAPAERRLESKSYELLPPPRSPVPGAGYLQFQQNLEALAPTTVIAP